MKSPIEIKQNRLVKNKLSKPATYATLALALIPFPKTLLAAEIENSTALPTLTVEGNALYDASSSEELTGYNVEAATVGTKTPAALKDIPQSITVITNDYIEDRGAVYLDDVTKTTPGLVTLANDSGRSSIFSRGYEYDDLLIDGLTAPVGSRQGTLPSLSAFDRVEIMRGPSGLFSSTSEMGGIINLVRKRATQETQASITGGAGSWGQYQGQADVSGSLNEDGSVRGRLVIDQTDASNNIDGNDNISESLYGTVEIDLDEDTELSVGILHQTKDITAQNGVPTDADGNLLDLDSATFLGGDWNDFNSESTNIFADLTHQFDNGGRGRIAARFSDSSSDWDYAYTNSAADSNGDVSSFTNFEGKTDEQSFALDASFSKPFEAFGNVSEYIIGFDHKQEDNHTDYETSTASGSWNIYDFSTSSLSKSMFTGAGKSSDTDTSEQEQAVYGKVTFRPIENLALITGARLSSYEISSLDNSDNSKVSDSGSHFTPYAGTVFDITETQALYASYSEVFKPQTSTFEDGSIIEPREGEQYEVGIKGTYAGGLLNSRLTAYQLTDENRPYDSDGDRAYEGISNVRVRGFEAELSGQFGQWDAILGYSYMDTEVLDGGDNVYFYLMPHHTFNAWAKYNLGESANRWLSDVSVGAGVTAVSHFTSTDNAVTAPGYTVVDASIMKQVNDNLKVTLNINNLLDEKYYARVGGEENFNFYGESRNFMLSANYTF